MLELQQTNLEEQKITNKALIEVKELPSGFKAYPPGSKVFYAPIEIGELSILNSGTLNIEQGYQFLLDSIVTQGFDKKELAYFDLVYIGIQRKLTAFGDIKGRYELQCPNCGQTVVHEFEYTSLEFKELEVEELPIKLNFNGNELHFGLITYQNFIEISNPEDIVDVYARMVKNKPYEEAKEIIKHLTGKEAKALMYLGKILDYGIKPIDLKCTNLIDVESTDENGQIQKEQIVCNTEFKLEVTSPFEVTFPEDTYVDLNQFKV